MLLIPAIIAGGLSSIVSLGAKALDPTVQTSIDATQKIVSEAEAPKATEPADQKGTTFNWGFGDGKKFKVTDTDDSMGSRVKSAVLETLIQVLWLPMQIIVFSFSAIIVALLYLKTRLAGGESMNDLIERFEDEDRPRKKWQERVRQRLIQSGRIPSKP
jgi:hypothetical protein